MTDEQKTPDELTDEQLMELDFQQLYNEWAKRDHPGQKRLAKLQRERDEAYKQHVASLDAEIAELQRELEADKAELKALAMQYTSRIGDTLDEVEGITYVRNKAWVYDGAEALEWLVKERKLECLTISKSKFNKIIRKFKGAEQVPAPTISISSTYGHLFLDDHDE